MRYAAVIEREGEFALVHFPDCPGCQTFAAPGQDIEALAKDALEGWLRAGLVHQDPPPTPSAKVKAPAGGRLVWVYVSPDLSVKLQLRAAREAAGLTQGQLAEQAGVQQQMIAKLESPRYHPRLDALDRVIQALGHRVAVDLVPFPATDASAVRSAAAKKRVALSIAAKRTSTDCRGISKGPLRSRRRPRTASTGSRKGFVDGRRMPISARTA